MKIVHTEWSDGWGGQEIRIIAEMEAFRARGYEMQLAARANSCIIKEAIAREFQHHIIEFGFAGNPKIVLQMSQLIRNSAADIVHTHSSKDSWIGGIASNIVGIPVVRSRHLSSHIKRKLTNAWVYRKFPAAIIASGQHITSQLVDDIGCNPAQVFSVPAGADECRFQPSKENRSAVRAELGIPEHTPVVGMVAVLRSWKGHHILIEAMHDLIQETPDLHLVIVGDGPCKEQIHQLAKNFNIIEQVHFLGHRPDVERYFPAFDLHILPSIKNEATSQVVPQAMLCGVANIVSNAGGLTEVIKDGCNGLVVVADDVSALRIAIRQLLFDTALRERLAKAGHKDALQRFTFTSQIDATESVYKKLLHR
jgi:glycosyltransferase involved in cell wall biosynthesis